MNARRRSTNGWRVGVRLVVAGALAAGSALGSVPASFGATRGAPTVERPSPLAPIPPAAPTQVVVFDRLTRASTVVSHDQQLLPGSRSSSKPATNFDGSQVAFQSDAALVAGDTNARADVYLWESPIDLVQRLSLGRNGAQANGNSRDPAISGDGGVIAFASTATNLTADRGFDADTNQVFAWQRSAGAVALVSVADRGAGSGASANPSVSADGRVVGFQSVATDLVVDDNNDVMDVYLRDLVRGATLLASVDSAGSLVTSDSGRPSVSGDGGAVVFDSTSGILVPKDSNGARDVFIRDLPPAVSVAPNPLDFGVVPLGTPANGAVTVVSFGWTPVVMSPSAISGTHAGDFVIAGDGCAGQILAYGAACSIAILDIPLAPGPRTATLSILDTALDGPQLVTLTGGVPGAEVLMNPQVGPPGIVTVLSGSGFPPGALVTVRWDRGITQPLSPAVVNLDGTFAVAVLVFHHDRIGPRQLLVTTAPGGAPFVDQAAAFLVVPPPLQPPGSNAADFLAPELRVILMGR